MMVKYCMDILRVDVGNTFEPCNSLLKVNFITRLLNKTQLIQVNLKTIICILFELYLAKFYMFQHH